MTELELQAQVAECSVAGCGRQSKCRGYCAKHYTRYYRHGDPSINLRHGVKKHPLYQTWLNMKNRCSNPKSQDWSRYGGRGIKVCAEWANDFECFVNDMGDRPKGYTLDRVDTNGDYCKDNCRWANKYEQAWNKANSRVKLRGIKKNGRSYVARITADRKEISKSFSDIEEAIAFRKELEKRYARA